MKRRLLSFILLICAVLALLPATSTTAEAAEPVTTPIIQQRIDELGRLLGGKYFTTTQNGCSDWGASECNVNNVIQTQWFKDMFGTIKSSQMFSNGGCSCIGFVQFASWYIFRDNSSDRVLREDVLPLADGAKFNYNANCKCKLHTPW